MVSCEAVQSSSRIDGGLGAGKEDNRQDGIYWFTSAKRMADEILAISQIKHVFINFALHTQKALVEGGFSFQVLPVK